MAGKIIGFVVSFGCAILFYYIGVYAQKLEKPIWFWSGTEVKPSQITDVKRYNKENALMWKVYSIWYFAAGASGIWSAIALFILLLMSCSVGLVILVLWYQHIFKKYKVK